VKERRKCYPDFIKLLYFFSTNRSQAMVDKV